MSKKHEKTNQKVPMSIMVPKKETAGTEENKEDKKKTTTTANPANNTLDFGRITFFSESRAEIQKIIEMVRPTTRIKPLAVSTGTFVKGIKKIGNNVTVRKSAQNEILSSVFESMLVTIILCLITQKQLNYNVNKSIFDINYPLRLGTCQVLYDTFIF
ncbi:hypothetical protein K2P96_02325 [Patescibacteria group bacterium]|nr:hypothetical protein [Patescibacteria group bacterium]